MHFEADPRGATLLAVMSLVIVGRADIARRWRNILRGTPPNLSIDEVTILDPHLPQQFHSRNLVEPLGSRWVKKISK